MPEVVGWDEVKGGLGDMFLTWEGDIDVRILSRTPTKFKHHFLEKSYYCLEGCPYCADGHAASTKYAVLVYVRGDGVVKVLESGPQLFGAIRALVEKYGHPWDAQYDITLHKEGSGMKTRYSALPVMQSSALNEQDIQAIKEGAFDLQDFYAQRIAYQKQMQANAAPQQAPGTANPDIWTPTVMQAAQAPGPAAPQAPAQPAAPIAPQAPAQPVAPIQPAIQPAIQPGPIAPAQPPIQPGALNTNGQKKMSNEEFKNLFG